MTNDQEHLRLLSIFHYVVGGLAGLFAMLPVFHLLMGLFITFSSARSEDAAAPVLIGLMFVIIPVLIILFGWAFAGAVLMAGRFLAKRRHYLFCLVVAGVECVFMPFGTVLGIFTIIVLTRESVKQLFQNPEAAGTVA